MRKKQKAVALILAVFTAISLFNLVSGEVVEELLISSQPAVPIAILEATYQPTDSEIKGKFVAFNDSEIYLGNLGYVLNLYPGTDISLSFPIKSEIKENVFRLGPKTTFEQQFSFSIPRGINKGEYTLQVASIDNKGQILGWDLRFFDIVGEDRFLTIKLETVKLFYQPVTQEQLDSLAVLQLPTTTKVGDIIEVPFIFGPTFTEKNPLPKVKFEVVNTSKQLITAAPHIVIRQDNQNGKIVRELDKETITLQAGETKNLILEMPKIDFPSAYHTTVEFRSNNELVSNVFRVVWVVGGESGKILNIKTLTDFFEEGKETTFLISVIGPADQSTVNDAVLKVFVKDNQGELCGRGETNITQLSSSAIEVFVNIPIKKNCFDPIITAQLSKANKVFSTSEIKIPSTSDEAQALKAKEALKIPKEEKKDYTLLFVIISVISLAIIIFILFLIFFIKKQKQPPKTLLFFIFCLFIFSWPVFRVQAANICGIEGGPSQRTIDGINFTCVGGTVRHWQAERAISQTEAINTADDWKEIYGSNINVRLYNPQVKSHSDPRTYASYWVVNTTRDNSRITLRNPFYRFPLFSEINVPPRFIYIQRLGGSDITFVALGIILTKETVLGTVGYFKEIYGYNTNIYLFDDVTVTPPPNYCSSGQVGYWRINTTGDNTRITRQCASSRVDFSWLQPRSYSFYRTNGTWRVMGVYHKTQSLSASGRVLLNNCQNSAGAYWISAYLEDTRTNSPDDWINFKTESESTFSFQTQSFTYKAMQFRSAVKQYINENWQISLDGKIPDDIPPGLTKVKVKAKVIWVHLSGTIHFGDSEETRQICLVPEGTPSGRTLYCEPDLIVSSAAHSPAEPKTADSVATVRFRGEVTNQGGVDVLETTITRLEIDTDYYPDFFTVTNEYSKDTLPLSKNGGSQTVDFPELEFSPGTHAYRICADAGNIVTEFDETNNCSEINIFNVTTEPPIIPPPIITPEGLSADFMCSLAEGNGWQDCDGFKAIVNRPVYFRDGNELPKHSKPYNEIKKRVWEKGGSEFNVDNNINASLTPESTGQISIKLIVTDGEGETAEKTYTINIVRLLPRWREIAPF